MPSIIELATGSTKTSTFGSGVNQALAVEAKSVFEVKEAVANLRKFAARTERTEKASLEMEKYNKMTITNGNDVEDGDTSYTNVWTIIDNQSLITFNSPYTVSVGFKLTPKLVRQARDDPAAFLERYRRKIAFDLAKKEDIYIGSYLCYNATNVKYGGAGTSKSTVGVGSVMTIELFEAALDDMKEREYEPTDFIAQTKIVGQLRRDARLLNDSDFSVAIKEDGSTVTQIGGVAVHEVKGTDIIPNFTSGQGAGSGTSGILIDREGAFGICDFLKSAGANPVTITVGKPDPTLEGANFHRILGQEELQVQALDQNAIIVVHCNKQ